MSDQNGSSSEEMTLQDFIETAHMEHEQTQRELKEIDVLIKQSAAEVERLAQRNAQVNNYVRQLQSNFDTVPREDIKEGYETLINAQQRLFTMRGQLEKLQSDQRNMERLADFQRRLLELVGGGGSLPAKARSMGGGDRSSVIRVIQTEEAAKQSLVRRMHDGPASSLSNFILQAEICQRFFDTDPARARAELNALKSGAASTFGTVKDFIFDLRPMMLDDLGVVPTLRRYIESFQEKNDVAISLSLTGLERRLEGHIEVTIFRAVQELLNNARMHGQATQIQVQLDLDQELVTAVVEDNGQGFNPDDASRPGGIAGIGLSTLRERLEMLDGELAVQSRLGQGTRMEFRIPVSPEIAQI
jgi:two-component system, NarL family, sensor histidine kinase DegS